MALTLLRARLYVFDGSDQAPFFAENDLSLQPEQVEYCLALHNKTREADTTRQTRFDPAGDTASLFDGYVSGEEDAFFEAFAERFLRRIRARELPEQGFDLLTCFLQEGDELWFDAFRLPYQKQLTHRVESFSGGWRSELVPSGGALPFPGSRTVCGALVSFSTCGVFLRDVTVRAQGKSCELMGQVVLDTADSLSPAESVKQVQKIALSLSEDDGRAPWEDAPDPQAARQEARDEARQQVRRALSQSLDRTGTLDMQYIAEEVFGDKPAVKERFQEQVERRGMDSVVPIESDRIRASLEKVRFTADDGVQITLPRDVADDPDRFEVAHNSDGTLSILIKGLQSLRKS